MIKLFGGKMGSSLRNHWLLNELEVPYEFNPVNLKEREHKKNEFLKLNPTGQVPVLMDGDFVLTESMAINEYIGLKFKPEILGDSPAKKAEAWKWSLWGYLNLQRYFEEGLYQALGIREQSEKNLSAAKEKLEVYLEILENHLIGKKFILGDKFTVADINVGVTMSYAKYSELDWAKYPTTAKWLELITSRPSYVKAVSE